MSVPDTVGTVRRRVTGIRRQFDRWLFQLPVGVARALAALLVTLSAVGGYVALRTMATTVAMPVLAQSVNGTSEVSSVLCGPGLSLGKLIGFALAAISMFLIVKAVIQGTIAFNKMGSSRAQAQFEGKQALSGAGKTAAGAAIPVVFFALIQSLNIDLAGCILRGIEGGQILVTALL